MSGTESSAADREQVVRVSLIELAHHAARFESMAILGEGNVSGRLDESRFLIKASGTQLHTLTNKQLVRVQSSEILASLDRMEVDDEQVESLLLDCRDDPGSLKPSVETLFHAWLLALPGVAFVGHTHPVHVNQLLCSKHAEDFATRRLFPDQIVYCGKESVLIPYVDPGMTLARRIAQEVATFMRRTSRLPQTILLENHGVIAIGGTARQVEATLLMAEKAAKVFVGAASIGGPYFLPDDQVERIAARSDEHYRQRMLETR